MIVAAGLTPAWQHVLVFDTLRPGEVQRASRVHWCASGKVLNVGIALHHLGAVPSSTVALAGGAPLEALVAEYRELGARAVWVRSRGATRVCTTLLETATRQATELVENAPPADSAELEEFLRVFAAEAAGAAVVVLTGSLPPGTPARFFRTLLERTAARGVVDARGPELLEALEARPFLVKPNREELARTLERRIDSEEDLVAALEELNRRGTAWAVATQGTGSVWARSQDGLFCLRPLAVEAVNPIGCGDSMAAGIAWSLARGATVLEALRVGVAAAAENAAQLLPSRLDRERVERLAREVEWRQVE